MKIAVIGAGKMGGRHGRSLVDLGAEVKILDPDQKAAEALATELGVGFSTRIEEAWEKAENQAVVIASPAGFHADQVIGSLKTGKHVLCEKPLCADLREAEAVLEAAQGSGLVLMTGYLTRYAPILRQVKTWLEEEILGEINWALFRIGGRGNHQPWKHLRNEGGGVVSEMLSHKLDLALWFFGELDSVACHARENVLTERTIQGRKVAADADDLVLVSARKGETRVGFVADFLSPSYVDYVEIHGRYGSIWASIVASMPSYIFLTEDRPGLARGRHDLKLETGQLIPVQMQDFLERIKLGQEDTGAAREALDLSRILAALESGRGGV